MCFADHGSIVWIALAACTWLPVKPGIHATQLSQRSNQLRVFVPLHFDTLP